MKSVLPFAGWAAFGGAFSPASDWIGSAACEGYRDDQHFDETHVHNGPSGVM
jgi:hypothetical protein